MDSELKKELKELIKEAIKDSTQNEWMKSKDLPNYLPIADSTIMENLLDLPFHMVGGTKFYNKKEIDKYLLNK